MKKLALALIVASLSAGAASAETCIASANAKKLVGAARTSFLTKCEKVAVTACTAAAAERNLRGAAETSFRARCVKDAVGQ